MNNAPEFIDVTVRYSTKDGSLAVYGPISDKKWMIACLENAIDAVKNHHNPTKDIIIPSKDISI